MLSSLSFFHYQLRGRGEEKVTHTQCLVHPAILTLCCQSHPDLAVLRSLLCLTALSISHGSPSSAQSQGLKIQNPKRSDTICLHQSTFNLLSYLICTFLTKLNPLIFFIYVIFASVLPCPIKCQECLCVTIVTRSNSTDFSRFN